jgi:hypothetical protein
MAPRMKAATATERVMIILFFIGTKLMVLGVPFREWKFN